ncbi:MAG: hypothetical protein ACI303_01485, partial [Lepagella sp.]
MRKIIASNAKNIGNYPYDINKAYGKKRARKHPWRPDRRQNYPETTQKLPRNYPETTQKLPRNKILIL